MSSVVSSARRRECPEEVDDDARRVVLHAVARLRRSLLPSLAGRRFPSFSFSESARSRGGVTLAPFILRTYARKRRSSELRRYCGCLTFLIILVVKAAITHLSKAQRSRLTSSCPCLPPFSSTQPSDAFPPFRKASSNNTHLWIHNNK